MPDAVARAAISGAGSTPRTFMPARWKNRSPVPSFDPMSTTRLPRFKANRLTTVDAYCSRCSTNFEDVPDT